MNRYDSVFHFGIARTAVNILAAKGLVDTPFAILNADDYYGVDAFKTVCDAIIALPGSGEACMMCYPLIHYGSASLMWRINQRYRRA